MKLDPKKIAKLVDILNELREKCPWDKKQTILTLRTNTIEECFELTDSILNEDYEGIKEELGDLLLHILFYSKIAHEQDKFTLDDVIDTICEKLIYRHPHIYGDTIAQTSEQVKENWEALKQAKKKRKGEGTLSGVPSSMPALPKAFRIGEKAASVGFDWDKREDVWDKVREEIEEVEAEMKQDTISNKEKLEGEFGDLFFALSNAARLYGIDPETALERSNRKFIDRFNYVEQQSIANHVKLSEAGLEQMDEWWEEAKKLERK